MVVGGVAEETDRSPRMANAATPPEGHSLEPQGSEALDCPFCDFSDSDAYFLTQHVELCHPEGGDSPFIVKDNDEATIKEASTDAETGQDSAHHDGPSDGYAECPHGCGEIVVASELTNHLDFHIAEEMALGDIGVALENDHPDSSNSNDLIEDRFATNISKALRDHDNLLKPSSSAIKGKQNGLGRTRRLGVRIIHPHEQDTLPQLTYHLAHRTRSSCT